MGVADIAQGMEKNGGGRERSLEAFGLAGSFAQILWPQSRASIKWRDPINSCHPFLSHLLRRGRRCIALFKVWCVYSASPPSPKPPHPLILTSFASHHSTVCKPLSPKTKEAAPPPFSSSSGVLGAGLCELDRLLQELNATQFNITGTCVGVGVGGWVWVRRGGVGLWMAFHMQKCRTLE